jgi:hypothetical protein
MYDANQFWYGALKDKYVYYTHARTHQVIYFHMQNYFTSPSFFFLISEHLKNQSMYELRHKNVEVLDYKLM